MSQTDSQPGALAERIASYPLLRALLSRRSRRFGHGQTLGGPLAHASAVRPTPLSHDEEAALAFAACGITGYALADKPYQGAPAVGHGEIMIHLIGRTVSSDDSTHTVTAFVVNDEGAWMLRRPRISRVPRSPSWLQRPASSA